MKITKCDHLLWSILHIDGVLDTKTTDTLQAFIDNEVDLARPLALDLSLVTFLSSAGLRAILLLSRRSKATGSQLALISVQQPILDTMEATGFLEYFTLYDELNELGL